MKLLRSEAEFFAWMRRCLEEAAEDDELRVGAPTQYPCFAYWRADVEDDPELGILYEADVSDMLTALHRAKNSTRENG